MKKIILGIVIASFLLAPVAPGIVTGTLPTGLQTAQAAESGFPPIPSSEEVKDPGKRVVPTDLIATLGNIADWIFYILIAVAVLFIVIAGIEYTTAQGDPEKIKAAGQKVLYALIGIIVAALAKGLVILVQYFPKGPDAAP